MDNIAAVRKSADARYVAIRATYKSVKQEFQQMTKCRNELFEPFYRHMVHYLTSSYAELMADNSAEMFLLSSDDFDTPIWQKGIYLDALVPGKAYQPKQSVSVQDAALASVATLFTMHSFGMAPPFVVLDQVDELITDERALNLLVDYLVRRSCDRQVIVLSDRKEVFTRASSLIGCLLVVSLTVLLIYVFNIIRCFAGRVAVAHDRYGDRNK